MRVRGATIPRKQRAWHLVEGEVAGLLCGKETLGQFLSGNTEPRGKSCHILIPEGGPYLAAAIAACGAVDLARDGFMVPMDDGVQFSGAQMALEKGANLAGSVL